MVKVYEIDMSVAYGEQNMEIEINVRIEKEGIDQGDIISFSWRNKSTLILFVRQPKHMTK